MIRRITFIVAALIILAAAHPATAQQAGKMHRIGYLHPNDMAKSVLDFGGGFGLVSHAIISCHSIMMRQRDGARKPSLRAEKSDISNDLVNESWDNFDSIRLSVFSVQGLYRACVSNPCNPATSHRRCRRGAPCASPQERGEVGESRRRSPGSAS